MYTADMNCMNRMCSALNRIALDRRPWVPSIYEHGPRVIGCAPVEACRSAELMAQAALRSWEVYGHDLVTVGVDIYNIEAEAFGCEVSDGDDESIPGIKSHPYEGRTDLDISDLAVPQPGDNNRLQLITDAARIVADEIGGRVWTYACMSGPFSQAVELRGFENLIVDMMLAPENVHALLEKTTELSLQQAKRLSAAGCGVNIFESWATLPLITVEIFGDYVVPYNRRIVRTIRDSYTTPPPAVIMGGDTAKLMDHFIEVGTSLVVADYLTDFGFMREKTEDNDIMIRGCVDPKAIERGDWAAIGESMTGLADKARDMRNFVWGCGAVSYNTTTENLLHFKQLCSEYDRRS